MSPRPALKERGPAPGPCLRLSRIFRLGQHDKRTRQFVGGECVSPRGDDQFTKLLHLTVLEVTRFVSKCLQFGIKVPWFAHRRLLSVDGEMIVEGPAQCCKVVRTAWDAVIPPENFSREGAPIRGKPTASTASAKAQRNPPAASLPKLPKPSPRSCGSSS